jgi:hypothetical protein
MGKRKYIETPEKLLEYFEEYKKETKNNPIQVQDYVGKDAEMVYRTKERPLTIDGFEVWLFKKEIIGDLSHYFANTDNKYSNYLTICSHIRKEVRSDQIEGGMAGIYNPSITQRLNNLVERQENTIVTEQPLFPDK